MYDDYRECLQCRCPLSDDSAEEVCSPACEQALQARLSRENAEVIRWSERLGISDPDQVPAEVLV